MGFWNTVQKLQDKTLPMCSMVVAAAGSSARMGGQDKLFTYLAGAPVLMRTLCAIDRAELVSEIVVAVQADRMEAVAELCARCALRKKVRVVKGGASRTESVLAAALECDPKAELIAIHDGARPPAGAAGDDRRDDPGGLSDAGCGPGHSGDGHREGGRRQRPGAVHAGPQLPVRGADAPGVPGGAFKSRPAIGHYLRGEYHRRLRRCRAAGQAGAAGARRWGEYQDHPAPGPHCGGGDSEKAGGEGMTNLRIGHGYDVHRLAAGRKLILGGVDIPYEKGLEGHSDADVLVHAVMDALLGAAGLEDIGCLFPDSSEEFRGISSLVLLERVAGELKKRSVTVVNIDATILAQAPKLAPYRARMRRNIAGALGIDTERVGVKATTEEGLGFTGDGNGMAAHAVALVERR